MEENKDLLGEMLNEASTNHNDPEAKFVEEVKIRANKFSKVYLKMLSEAKAEQKEKQARQEKKAAEMGKKAHKNISETLSKIFSSDE